MFGRLGNAGLAALVVLVAGGAAIANDSVAQTPPDSEGGASPETGANLHAGHGGGGTGVHAGHGGGGCGGAGGGCGGSCGGGAGGGCGGSCGGGATLAAPDPADIAAGAEIFAQTCATCHSLGGGDLATGPDLLSARQRPDMWMRGWLTDPAAWAASRPCAATLVAQWPEIMPDPNLDERQIEQVIAWLRAERAAALAEGSGAE
jgi:mono/diheme cytochrome c family protein